MADAVTHKPTILIIDDDEQVRNVLTEVLSVSNECTAVSSAEDALAVLATMEFELVISDINMGGISGLDLVPRVLKRTPDTVVVMISGQQTIDFAIDAMRVGAFDYITKPLTIRQVETAVRRAISHHRLLKGKRQYEEHLEDLVRERTAEIERLAHYDRLTDLPNRKLFSDRCTQALTSAQRHNQSVAVLLVSLDRFKKIADTLGQGAADIVLSEAAARLQTCAGEGDTVARFDGDEFALLLTQIGETGELIEVGLAIREAFKPAFRLGGQDVYLTASVGISLYPFNGGDVATIVKNAGAALYRAKSGGGNCYQFYTADMNSMALKRLALETGLRRAVENEEFINLYQPILNLNSGELVGVEALVRWRNPQFGVLPAGKFIGLAEDTGIIVDIDYLVMRAACIQTRAWQATFGDLRVAVNVSARHFGQKSFLQRIVGILDETNLDPDCLELELTETSIIENGESAARLLAEIRDLGVKIAIDDFGTGYSSLGYLKSLPIDSVKLDRSFVQGATTDPDDAALVRAIVTLAHNLRLRVTAEGVETNEQVTFLRLLNCDEGQGYLFGWPMAAEIFEPTFAADRKRKKNVVLLSSQTNLSSAINE